MGAGRFSFSGPLRVRSGLPLGRQPFVLKRGVDRSGKGRGIDALDIGSMVSRKIKLEQVNEGFRAMEAGEVIRSVIV